MFHSGDLHALDAEHEDSHAGALTYGRVSCAGQKDDLVRQIEGLERAEGPARH